MATNNDENTKKKAFNLSAILGNPYLSQSIWDSFSAPVGSTKNTKAKSVISSMNRANQVDQGMSSAYDEYGQFKDPNPQDNKFRNIQDIIDAQNAPKRELPTAASSHGGRGIIRGIDDLINWSKTPVSREKGESRLDVGVKEMEKAGLRIPTNAGNLFKSFETDVIYPWTNLGSTFMQNMYSTPGRIGSYITDPEWGSYEKGKSLNLDPYRGGIAGKEFPLSDNRISFVSEPIYSQKKYYKVVGDDKVYDSKTHKHITAEQAAKIPNFWDNVSEVLTKPTDFSKWIKKDLPTTTSSAAQGSTSQEDSNKRYKDLLMTKQDPTTAAYEAKWASGFDPNIELVNKELETNPDTNQDFGSETIKNNPKETEETYNNFDNSEKDFWNSTYKIAEITSAEEAVKLGLGSEYYADKVMSNPEMLGKILHLSKEEIAALPKGMLQKQLFDINDALKDEYQIDEQRKAIHEGAKRDLHITDDFITYIHNKDEYLNEVSALLVGAKKRIAEMDTSNPNVAKRMGMYVDYLTILQGRQNQRYIDFLGEGIKDHKNKLDRLTIDYNSDIELFNAEWLKKKAVRTENYNNMHTALENIYKKIETAKQDQAALAEWEWKETKTAEIQVKKLLASEKIKNTMFGDAGKEVNASTAKMFKDIYSAGENDDGTLNFKTYNPYDVANQAKTNQQNSASAVNSFMTDMGYTVSKSVGSGSLDQFEKFKEAMKKNISNNIVDEENMNEKEKKAYNALSEEEKKAFHSVQNSLISDQNTMYTKLQTNLEAGLEEYFGSTEEKIKELRKAIEDLNQHRGWKSIGNLFGQKWGSSPEKEKFVKNHSNLQEKLTGALYDYTMQTVEAGGLSGPRDVWGDIPDNNLPKIVSEKLPPYLML